MLQPLCAHYNRSRVSSSTAHLLSGHTLEAQGRLYDEWDASGLHAVHNLFPQLVAWTLQAVVWNRHFVSIDRVEVVNLIGLEREQASDIGGS